MAPKNKLLQNIEAYQKERNTYLEKQYAFKFGDVKFGVGAASLLRSMYIELIYSTHITEDEKEAGDFLLSLSNLYDAAAKLQNNDKVKTPAMAVGTEEGRKLFIPVVEKLDATYCQLKKYEKKCGFE
jgi:hypothetical protein